MLDLLITDINIWVPVVFVVSMKHRCAVPILIVVNYPSGPTLSVPCLLSGVRKADALIGEQPIRRLPVGEFVPELI